MKRKIVLFSSALMLIVVVKATNFLSLGGTEDFCLKTSSGPQLGVCNTKEGMPAEEGEGTVSVKWCESEDGPAAKNCSGNSLSPQIL